MADVKSAGIGLSVLTLVGAGGQEHAESHVGAELLSFSVPGAHAAATRFFCWMSASSLVSMVKAATATSDRGGMDSSSKSDFKQALSPLRERGVKVLPYSLEKQWA